MKRKLMTVKEWKSLSIIEQGHLTKYYEVILTDYDAKAAERKGKIKNALKKINFKNFDKGLKKFDEGQKKFWKDWDAGMEKGFGKSVKEKPSVFPKDKRKVKII